MAEHAFKLAALAAEPDPATAHRDYDEALSEALVIGEIFAGLSDDNGAQVSSLAYSWLAGELNARLKCIEGAVSQMGAV